MIETNQGNLPKKEMDQKLSWEETFQEMAKEGEDWGDFDVSLTDGLERVTVLTCGVGGVPLASV
jgi:hypothetical protein